MSDVSEALEDFLDEALELLPIPPPIPLIDMPLTCRNDERRDCQPPGLEDCVSEHKSVMSFFRLNNFCFDACYMIIKKIGWFNIETIPNITRK